ncbi:chaplin [Kitasatospora sp. P5_F3]
MVPPYPYGGSGNSIQVPVHIPVNLCGNSANLVGLLNPSFGNSCANVEAPPMAEEDC